MTGFGKHALEHLPSDLAAVGARKPLVITDKSVTERKGTAPLINAFRESGMTIGIVDSVNDSSNGDTVREISHRYMNRGFDSILALGSFHVANLAKVVNLSISDLGASLQSLSKAGRINTPLKPFFLIPSGSGSGFETSGEAAVDSLSFSSPFLMPDKVIIDPRLMAEDCLENAANEAMATLACCTEAHGVTPNPLVRSYASTAITLVMENIELALESFFNPGKPGLFSKKASDKGQIQARLASAAAMNGYVFSNCHDLVTVKLGRSLAGLSPVKPGILMAILLPSVLEYRSGKGMEPMERLMLPLAGVDSYCATPEAQRFDQAMAMVRNLINGLFQRSCAAIPRTLEDAGIQLKELTQLAADWPVKDGCGLSKDEIGIILAHAHSGKPMKQGKCHVRT